MFEEKKFISKRCKIMIISVTLLAIVMIAWGVGVRISHTAHADIDDNDVVSTTTHDVVSTTTTMTNTTSTTTTNTTTTETTDETTSTTSNVAITTQTTIGYIRDIPTRNEVHDEEVVNNAQLAIVHPVEAITINDSDPIETINETVAIDTTTESTTTTTTVVTTSTSTSTEEVTTDESTTTVEEVVTESADEVYLGNFRITGYVATGCKTASGTWPAAGRTIAMNKSQMNSLGLKYGDQIRVDGLGTYTLEDCGCKSGRIDVFCNSVKECYALPSYLDAYLVN